MMRRAVAVIGLDVSTGSHLQLGTPTVGTDLTAGGRRLVQDAVGYLATIKSGETTFENGRDTGARPGVLVRGAR